MSKKTNKVEVESIPEDLIEKVEERAVKDKDYSGIILRNGAQFTVEGTAESKEIHIDEYTANRIGQRAPFPLKGDGTVYIDPMEIAAIYDLEDEEL